MEEIAEAMLISDTGRNFPIDELPDSIDKHFIDSEILDHCSPLIEVQSRSPELTAGKRTLHLSHFSVKEYLLRKFSTENKPKEPSISTEQQQNSILAILCLKHLSFEETWLDEDEKRNCQLDAFRSSFRSYAITSWHRHIRFGVSNDTQTMDAILAFVADENHSWRCYKEHHIARLKKAAIVEATRTKLEESFGAMIVDNTTNTTRHIYILQRCKALTLYNAPTHRVEEYLMMSARILRIEEQFVYIPSYIFVSLENCHSTNLLRLDRIRPLRGGRSLGKLRDIHYIYKDVAHENLDVGKAVKRLASIVSDSYMFSWFFKVLILVIFSVATAMFWYRSLV